MSDDLKRTILQKVMLPELIGEFVPLQKSSGNYRGCCPFHNEKTPSFYVYADHFHCFGCRAHGDAIDFIRKQVGLGFIDTLKWLGQKTGTDVSELSRDMDSRENKARLRRNQVVLAAQEFFVGNLWDQGGKHVVSYLTGRGFSETSIKTFGFGYAKNSSTELVTYLKDLGFTFEEMEQASLATFYESDGKWHDFFRNRVLIPIRDGQGRLIAFGGRALDESPQKYKNSRYDKGNVLFGLSEARSHIKKKGRAVVVEGYLDALKMWQCGFQETVASQGTALTLAHLKHLSHVTGLVYLLFDGDSAGQNATMRVLSEAMNVPDINIRVVTLPDTLDPDEFLMERGAEALESQFAGAIDIVQYAIQKKLQSKSSTSIPDVVTKELLPWIRQTSDPVRRAFLVSRVSQLSSIPEGVLLEELLKDNSPKFPFKAEKPEQVDHLPISEPTPTFLFKAPAKGDVKEILAHLFFAEPGEIDLPQLLVFLKDELRLSQGVLQLAEEFLQILSDGVSPSRYEIGRMKFAQEAEVPEFIMHLLTLRPLYEVQNRARAISILISKVRADNIRSTVQNLKTQVGRVDGAELSILIREIQSLQSELFVMERDMRNARNGKVIVD